MTAGAVRLGTGSTHPSSLAGGLLRGLCLCYTHFAANSVEMKMNYKKSLQHAQEGFSISVSLPALSPPGFRSFIPCRCPGHFQGIANSWFLPSALLLSS